MKLDAKGQPLAKRHAHTFHCHQCGQSFDVPLEVRNEYRPSLGRLVWFHVTTWPHGQMCPECVRN